MVSEYLDLEGLAQYDANIKRYIDKKLKELVALLNLPTNPETGEVNKELTDVVTEAEMVDSNRWESVANDNGGTDIKYNDTVVVSIPHSEHDVISDEEIERLVNGN